MAGASGIVSRSECNCLQNNNEKCVQHFTQFIGAKLKYILHVKGYTQLSKFTDRYERWDDILSNSIVNQNFPYWLGCQGFRLVCIQIKHLLNRRYRKIIKNWWQTQRIDDLFGICGNFYTSQEISRHNLNYSPICRSRSETILSRYDYVPLKFQWNWFNWMIQACNLISQKSTKHSP